MGKKAVWVRERDREKEWGGERFHFMTVFPQLCSLSDLAGCDMTCRTRLKATMHEVMCWPIGRGSGL